MPDILSLLGQPERAQRVHHERFPVADIVINPEENYRWGSAEAMEADLKQEKLTGDGIHDVASSYEQLKRSIAISGVEEPVGLVKRDDGYHPIYGFTRCVAAREVGIDYIPAYVYEDVSEDEAVFLQVRENSVNLKREVCWIHEVRAFDRLVKKAVAAAKAQGRDPKSEIANIRAAVANALGRQPTTLRNRAGTLSALHPRVVTLALKHNWTHNVCLEFLSGDVAAPYSDDFIDEIIAAYQAHDPTFARITPTAVRTKVKKLLAETGDKTKVFADGVTPTTAGALSKVDGDMRLSPGVGRDAATVVMLTLLREHKVNLRSATAQALDSLAKTGAWHRCVGIGIALGEVGLPPGTEPGTETVAAKNTYAVTARRWGTICAITALLRVEIEDRGHNFDAWLGGTSVVEKSKRTNRAEFVAAVREGLAVGSARRDSDLLEAARAAWNHLNEYAPVKGTPT